MGGETCLKSACSSTNGAKIEHEDAGPKIDFEPTSVGEPWHEESIGHVFFQFRTKIRCQPPSHTSFPRQKSAKNRFFLGDVFVFRLDFFDMLDGSGRCEAICAPFFWASVLKN